MVTVRPEPGFGIGYYIRRAIPADIPEISMIEKEAFSDPWGEEGIREAMTLYLTSFFVAVADGKIIGFVGGGLENTGEVVYGHLCTLFVAEQYRSRGLGRALSDRIDHDFILHGATAVQLEVRISNLDAIAFYRSLGYQEIFTYDSYYKDGEDGIVMMKWFSS